MDKKNKIDSAIDEVIESQRLRQGAGYIKKGLGFGFKLAIIFGILLLVGVAIGIVK